MISCYLFLAERENRKKREVKQQRQTVGRSWSSRKTHVRQLFVSFSMIRRFYKLQEITEKLRLKTEKLAIIYRRSYINDQWLANVFLTHLLAINDRSSCTISDIVQRREWTALDFHCGIAIAYKNVCNKVAQPDGFLGILFVEFMKCLDVESRVAKESAETAARGCLARKTRNLIKCLPFFVQAHERNIFNPFGTVTSFLNFFHKIKYYKLCCEFFQILKILATNNRMIRKEETAEIS